MIFLASSNGADMLAGILGTAFVLLIIWFFNRKKEK
jgi:hypothetical protein